MPTWVETCSVVLVSFVNSEGRCARMIVSVDGIKVRLGWVRIGWVRLGWVRLG